MNPPSARPTVAGGASVVLIAALTLACQSATPGRSGTPSSGRAAGAGSPEVATTVGPPSSPAPAESLVPVMIDASLLDVLPDSVAGIPVTQAADEAALALTDAALPRFATALDVGVAVDPKTANLVTAHVVKLRPDAFTDELYRQWRDSYDVGACAAAGGVVAAAETTIDDRTVFVTTCSSGLRAYHLWLADQNLLISASSVGDARFGDVLIGQLRV